MFETCISVDYQFFFYDCLSQSASHGDIHPSEMNDFLSIALGKLEHLDHVRGAGQGATLSNYFHTSRRHRQGFTNEEVARLMEARLQEERKIQEDEWKRQEDEWKRREDDFRFSFMFEMKKIAAGVPKVYQSAKLSTTPSYTT